MLPDRSHVRVLFSVLILLLCCGLVLAGGAALGGTPARVVPVFEDFPLNIALFRAVNSHRHPALDFVFHCLVPLGMGWFLIPVLLGVLLFRRTKAAFFLVAIGVESLLVTVLKRIADQPRPGVLLGHVHLHEIPWLQYSTPMSAHSSFPSGDTAMAFAIATVLAYGARWPVKVILFAYAVLIAIERMYIGAHFPLDVTAGALIGVGSGLLPYAVAKWWRLRKERNTAFNPDAAST